MGKALFYMPQLPHLVNGNNLLDSVSLILGHALQTVSSSQAVRDVGLLLPWGQGLDPSLGNKWEDFR